MIYIKHWSILFLLSVSLAGLFGQEVNKPEDFTFENRLTQLGKVFSAQKMIVANVNIRQFDTDGSGELINEEKVAFYFASGKYRIEYKRVSGKNTVFAEVYGCNGINSWVFDAQKSTIKVLDKLIPNIPMVFNPILPEAGKILAYQTYGTEKKNKIKVGSEENPYLKICTKFNVDDYSPSIVKGSGIFEIIPPQMSAGSNAEKDEAGFSINFERTYDKKDLLILGAEYFIDENIKKKLNIAYSQWKIYSDESGKSRLNIPGFARIESQKLDGKNNKIIFSDYTLLKFSIDKVEEDMFEPPIESASKLIK